LRSYFRIKKNLFHQMNNQKPYVEGNLVSPSLPIYWWKRVALSLVFSVLFCGPLFCFPYCLGYCFIFLIVLWTIVLFSLLFGPLFCFPYCLGYCFIFLIVWAIVFFPLLFGREGLTSACSGMVAVPTPLVTRTGVLFLLEIWY
jgi:hypothetical protein